VDVVIVDCGEVRVQAVCPSHRLYFDLQLPLDLDAEGKEVPLHAEL
jgi:hypothetical protein